eukprot:Sspe_Gene.5358::Locus_1769_Transcript_1_1_Confidence_1.000_Length_1486::g.5358::m.5358
MHCVVRTFYGCLMAFLEDGDYAFIENWMRVVEALILGNDDEGLAEKETYAARFNRQLNFCILNPEVEQDTCLRKDTAALFHSVVGILSRIFVAIRTQAVPLRDIQPTPGATLPPELKKRREQERATLARMLVTQPKEGAARQGDAHPLQHKVSSSVLGFLSQRPTTATTRMKKVTEHNKRKHSPPKAEGGKTWNEKDWTPNPMGCIRPWSVPKSAKVPSPVPLRPGSSMSVSDDDYDRAQSGGRGPTESQGPSLMMAPDMPVSPHASPPSSPAMSAAPVLRGKRPKAKRSAARRHPTGISMRTLTAEEIGGPFYEVERDEDYVEDRSRPRTASLSEDPREPGNLQHKRRWDHLMRNLSRRARQYLTAYEKKAESGDVPCNTR